MFRVTFRAGSPWARHLVGNRRATAGCHLSVPKQAFHSANGLHVRQRSPLPSITQVSASGVKLADGQEYPPTCIFLDGRAFVWSPPAVDKMKAMPNGLGWEAWSNDLWSIFELTAPRPGDVVLPVPTRIKSYLNSLGIQLDVQNTVRFPF
ncbi:hypothetical protein MNAN1_000366e, partial [Malassezia nana]